MDFAFTDAKNGYLAGGANGVGANALKTDDGGMTWTQLPIAPVLFLLATATDSDSSAIMAGEMLLAGGTQYTTDGNSFTNSSMPLVTEQESQSAEIIGDNEGYAVAGLFGFYAPPGKNQTTVNGVAISTDGGASFSFVDMGAGDNHNRARYCSFPSSQVGFISSGHWPVNTKKYGKYLSRNIHAHSNLATKEQYIHLDFDHSNDLPLKKGEAGWQASIFRSTDGFQTWTEVFSNSTYYMNAISCPSENVCFAVGENDAEGYGMRTTDGGTTWETILVAPGYSMMAAVALSEDEFYFGGGVLEQAGINGTVWQSTDGGDSFTTTNLEGTYLASLTYLDSEHGWAAGLNAQGTSNVLIYA
jgi:photosystem II stability/assembly factor-like uncharacterized protein